MPEIGLGTAGFFALLAFIGGWIIGVQEPLILQGIIVVACIALLNTWFFRQLELGILAYYFIFVGLVVGLIVGDVSYMWQSGGVSVDTGSFFDLFKVE